MDPCTLLVVGLPRSGSTLTCELLNALPDTVALDEPMDMDAFTARPTGRAAGLLDRRPATHPERVAANVGRFLAAQRASLLAHRTAVCKSVDGKVIGAKVADERGVDGRRVKLAARGPTRFDKDLSPQFLLAAKHNSAFAGVLAQLVSRFPVRGVVRNPLAILSSWQTVPFAVSRGHATLAEAFDPGLRDALARIDDVLDRQVRLMSWFFTQFDEHLPRAHVVRYEDLVTSGGAALSALTPRATGALMALRSRNSASVYDPEQRRRLGQRLLDSDGGMWRFYDRGEVAGLLAQEA